MSPRARRARGFTLIELLVALFICVIIFSMGYGALNQAISNREQVEQQAQRLLAVQQAIRMLEQDFELMQPRPVRDLLGSGYLAPLVFNANALASSGSSSGSTSGSTAMGDPTPNGDANSAPVFAPAMQASLVNFTRGGWANPAGVPRSELQRVAWLLRGHQLVRQHLPVLDADSTARVQEQVLLEDVEAFSLRFMDGSLSWQAPWPTPLLLNGPPADLLRIRPVAVEVTLRLKDYGTIRRIIEVAG